MQVWAPRIVVSLPALSSGVPALCFPRSLSLAPLSCSPVPAVHRWILPRSGTREGNEVRESHPGGVHFDFLPLVPLHPGLRCGVFLLPDLTTYRPDSEQLGGLDLFSNVPFPPLRIKATRRVATRNSFGKQFAF